MRIAILMANRGFFPSRVIETAYDDLKNALAKAGLDNLAMDDGTTQYNAVETTADGMKFAAFLEDHRNEYDGLIICLPNFGDENGIKAAIKSCTVPILLQAYPDEIGKMDFENRRDAFCGKLALTSVLKQMGTKFTCFKSFTVHPSSEEFQTELKKFAGICRVTKRMQSVRLGALGARITAFKSTRFDEMCLERHGIDVETYDLSDVFMRVDSIHDQDTRVIKWLERLNAVTDFSDAPDGRDILLAKFAFGYGRFY